VEECHPSILNMEAAGSCETLAKIWLHGVTSQKAVAYSPGKIHMKTAKLQAKHHQLVIVTLKI
jgi:hypothetical protein